MNYHNGSVYTGSWLKGKQQGRGRFVFPNSDWYEG